MRAPPLLAALSLMAASSCAPPTFEAPSGSISIPVGPVTCALSLSGLRISSRFASITPADEPLAFSSRALFLYGALPPPHGVGLTCDLKEPLP